MDKYEYKVRSEEIKELIARREYVQAAEIADTIDWRRVKSVMMLCTISDLYKINRRFEDSRDLLLLAYDRHPGGRSIVYALCELSIKMGELPQAVEYCKEFVQIAPKDSGRYILQYKIYEAQEVSLEERIAVLEELKKRDYIEKWAYELAYLYHRIGLASKCVDECDEMIVWFGDGKYVIKAMELKMLHQPLTPEQQEKYDRRFAPQVEEVLEENIEETAKEVPSQEPAEAATVIWSATEVARAASEENVQQAETRRIPAEEIDIQVKTMDPSQCNTINLQEEVAAGLRELWEGKTQQDEVSEQEEETKVVAITAMKELQETSKEAQEAIGAVAKEVQEASEVVPEEISEEVQDIKEAVAEEVVSEEMPEAVQEAMVEAEQEPEVEEVPPTTAQKVMEQLRQETVAEPPKEMAKVLSMEADGQISFVMPEKEALEKQITGQISIEDIMAEWERMKKELEEKGKEKVRQHVKENTGQMFNEFEASVRDGLLEQLENGRDVASVIAEAEGRDLEEDDIQVPPSLLEDEEDEPEQEGVIVEFPVQEAQQKVYVEEYVEEESVQEEVYVEEYVEEESVQEEVYVEEAQEEESVQEEVYVEEAEEEESVQEEVYVEESAGEDPALEDVYTEEAQEETVFVVENTDESATEEVLTSEDVVEELAEIEEVSEEEALMNPVDAAYEAALLGAMGEAVMEETVEEVTFEEEEAEDAYTETEMTEELAQEIVEEILEEESAYEEADEQEEEADTPQLRNLTKEEKELFTPYIQGKASKEQLIRALDSISMAAYTGNVIVTGSEGLDTLGLAKNIIRDVQMTDNNFSGKTAKISGASLNKRDVNEVLNGLCNGALIIQKAADMNAKTVEILHRALQQENTGMVVVLEGTKKAMNAFLEQNEKLHSCFTARIDMEALSDAALVAFGKKYARENECIMDELAILELHRIITQRQTNDHAVTLMEVKEVMDDVIASANRKSIGHFFDILTGKRYDDDDMIVIRQKDFQ